MSEIPAADYVEARHNMVESQIRTNKVTDTAVIQAFQTVPRERFVPLPLRGIAYVDDDIQIAEGRCVMEPMVLARLLQIAAIRQSDVALNIGCGTGYATAVLAQLCDAVVGLDSDPKLVEKASHLLTELGIDNAVAVEGDLVDGYAKQAPYDVILIGGAIGAVPEGLKAQLAPGGRLIAVMQADRAQAGGIGQANVFVKHDDMLSGRPVFDASTPPLPEFAVVEQFVF